MQFTMGGLKPTTITEGFGGNGVNSTHLIRTYGLDKKDDQSLNATGIAELFSATDRYSDKPMIGMTEAKGKKIYLTSNQYSWKLRGHMKQVSVVTEVIEASSQPGILKGEFQVVLNRGWYKEPDVLQGESNLYNLEIVGEPYQKSTGFVYTFRLQTDDPAVYFPTDYIQLGREFRKVSTSVVDEENSKYGTIQFNSIFELRSQTGNVAEMFKFTDKALRVDKNSSSSVAKHWSVPFYDSKGYTHSNFMPLAEAEMMNQVYDDIEWGLVFGRKSTRNIAPGGYVKRTGPGYREQAEYGHTLLHNNNLTLSRLDQWLNSIYRGRKDATPDKRRIVLVTGEMGAQMFHNMVASEASAFLTVDSHYITKETDVRHLAFGAQFTHYRGLNGLDVTVMLNPAYDNPDFCPEKHPIYTDSCIDSWRMDILDFGMASQATTASMGDNISMVCEQFADYFFTTAGKWDPKTGMPINDGSAGLAGGLSGYATHVEKSFGLWIKDISRCGTIRLKVTS